MQRSYIRWIQFFLHCLSTESPLISIERVIQRVELRKCPVVEDKILNRYFDSSKNLKLAGQVAYRTFIFDNSGAKPNLIHEVFNGEEVTFFHEEIPHWGNKY